MSQISGNNIPVKSTDLSAKALPKEAAKAKRSSLGGTKQAANEERTSYNVILWYLLDKFYLDARAEYKARAGANNSEMVPCFTHNQVTKYQLNCYYRYVLFGSLIGGTVYLTTFLFLILSEAGDTNKFKIFHNLSESQGETSNMYYLILLLISISITLIIRFIVINFLRVQILLVLQALILLLAAVGSHKFDCQKVFKPPQFNGAGSFPLATMSVLYYWFNSNDDLFTSELWESRCDGSFERFEAVNLLAELVCFGITVRMLFL